MSEASDLQPQAINWPEPEASNEELPYARHSISAGDVEAVTSALAGERIAQGPQAAALEEELARVSGVSHAISVSSGTAALHVALQGLGVGPGDEVIVPSLTFLATANAVLFCGAKPVFADVDSETLTLDPADVDKRVNERTRGVIPMHYGGHPADVEVIRDVVGSKRFVLEDACHALGASLRGRPVGSLGDAACFSFHPAKLITTGEGGAVVTGSEALAQQIRPYREHGVERNTERFEGLGLPAEHAAEQSGGWVHEMHALATNYRMAEPAAALGRSQLERMEDFVERRMEVVEAYDAGLGDLDTMELPVEAPGCRSAWHLYPIRLRNECLRQGRAAVFESLRKAGLGVQVHYIPVHLQPYYRNHLGSHWGQLPVTEDAYLRLISLPLFPAMTDADVSRVIDTVRAVIRGFER